MADDAEPLADNDAARFPVLPANDAALVMLMVALTSAGDNPAGTRLDAYELTPVIPDAAPSPADDSTPIEVEPLNADATVKAVLVPDVAIRAAALVIDCENPVRLVNVTPCAPQTDIVHEVDAAAHDNRCAAAYSPAEILVEANVNGCTLLLAQPC